MKQDIRVKNYLYKAVVQSVVFVSVVVVVVMVMVVVVIHFTGVVSQINHRHSYFEIIV